MKSRILTNLAISTAAVVAILVPTVKVFAASSSLNLSPASASVAVNNSFSVGVYETGDNVNVVTAKLGYDPSKLVCNSAGGGSDFSATQSASCGGGSINITRYTAGGESLSGTHLVGTISFTAIAGSGTTAVNFASGSQVASAGVNTLASTSGGTYTLTTPAAAPVTPGKGSGTASTPASQAAANSAAKQAAATQGTAGQSLANKPATANNSSTDQASSQTAANTGTNTKQSVAKVLAAAKYHQSAQQATKNNYIGASLVGLIGAALVAIYFIVRRRKATPLVKPVAAASSVKKAKTKAIAKPTTKAKSTVKKKPTAKKPVKKTV